MRDGKECELSYGTFVRLHVLDFHVQASVASTVSLKWSALGVRRDKAALSSGCKSHPATAPAGSNRSSQEGNELAEAFGMREAFEVKHYFTAFSTSFITVSLFDLESRFFAPTHTCWKPARAGAVKAGRRSALASPSFVSRPRLDRPEHGGTLVVVGMTRPRGARSRGTRDSRRNLVSGRSIRT